MYCDCCSQPMIVWDDDGDLDNPSTYVCVDCDGFVPADTIDLQFADAG